jgi:DNA-binding GntR family transcriptional regulator
VRTMYKKDRLVSYRVHEWMIAELGLGGNELTVYAMIHEYTVERGEYSDTYQYLAECTGCHRVTAIKAVKDLAQRGLISKVDDVEKGYVVKTHLSTLRNEVR